MLKKLKLKIGNLGVRDIKFTARKLKIDLHYCDRFYFYLLED